MFRAYMIIDGQWGSTGKGLLCGYLSRLVEPDVVVCNFGANAGHTYVYDDGKTIMTQQLPTAAITGPKITMVLIGPGSIIDQRILLREMDMMSAVRGGLAPEIYIHERAAVITQEHKDIECKKLNSISSTCKGVGAAQASKVMREPDCTVRDYSHLKFAPARIVSDKEYVNLLCLARTVQIESAQGFELGVNTGSHYPYCTARDVTPWQVLSDCAIPQALLINCDRYVVMRTFPIRVGNAFDKDGSQIGWSGPVYDDQQEVEWGDFPGVEPEKTTVTKKVRRIFTFSYKALERMIYRLDPTSVFLNFVNYLEEDPTFNAIRTQAMILKIEETYRKVCINHGLHIRTPFVRWIGTGPRHGNVLERPWTGDVDES